MLNQSYAEDKLLAELMDEHGGDVVAIYFGLIPFQDRDGRLHGSPHVLKGRCWPRSKRVTPEAIETAISVLHGKQLLIRYEVDGEAFILFPNFRKNQSAEFRYEREAESRIPPPPAELLKEWRKPRERVLSGPAPVPDQLRTSAGPGSGPTPAEVKLREEKVSEEKLILCTKSEAIEPAPSAPETESTALVTVGDGHLPQSVLTEVVRDVVRYYRQKHTGKGRQLKPGHRDWRLIEARVREGFSADELKQAIDGNALDDWHRQNPAGHTVEYVFRNTTKVEGFIARATGTGPPAVISKRGKELQAMLAVPLGMYDDQS